MSAAAVKNSKETRDEKQRDAKIEEQVLKSLGNSAQPEEKFAGLMKKYVELAKENKKFDAFIKQHEKRFELISREKDNLQKEYNKGVLVKDKLEEVCREQQKLIKTVKNESMTKIREEEEKRKENQMKFQHSINEINITLLKNSDENIKLKDDNIEMTKKLKYLAEQYQLREKQLEKINEQVSLESQLHDAKLAKVQMEATIEKEILLKEKQAALDDLLRCKRAIQELTNREELLKEQLSLYTTKYDDFKSSLQKSNDIFVTYKTELEKMAKRTKKLEKESFEWKRKWEKSNAKLIDLSSEKQVRDEHITKTAKQMHQLQKLLRTLQAERTLLHQTLKENNIEAPPTPVLPPEPVPLMLVPPPTKLADDKVEKMAKNCADLKETLARLQGQMNAMTNKQSEQDDAVASSDSKKANTAKRPKLKLSKKHRPKESPVSVEVPNVQLAVNVENSPLTTNTVEDRASGQIISSGSDDQINVTTVVNSTEAITDLTDNFVQLEVGDEAIVQTQSIENGLDDNSAESYGINSGTSS